ncbi:hypothetical protein FACS189487_05390 [Campylobacterota bacterium]|nr:hypothetical protein FACS189487_05390 [Campylobacterota bacterium]
MIENSTLTQHDIELLFSRHTTKAQIAEIAGTDQQAIKLTNAMQDLGLEPNEVIACLTAFVELKGKPIPYQSMATKIGFKLESIPARAIQMGINILDKIFEIPMYKLTDGGQLIPLVQFGKRLSSIMLLKMFDLPSIVPLKDLKDSAKPVLSYDPYVEENELQEEYCVDVINKLQKIPFMLTDQAADFDESLHVEAKKAAYAKKALGSGRTFHFEYNYDFRGRIYSSGFHLNPQGTPYDKASLTVADPQVLTDTGRDWLYIDLANHLGFGKAEYADRIEAAKKYIEAVQNDYPKDDGDKKHLIERDANILMSERKYVSSYIWLDASASGIQLMTLMGKGSIEELRRVNLASMDYSDPYAIVADAINNITGKSYSRKMLKIAIMTYFYNSIAEPRKALGEDFDLFESVMKLKYPSAMKVMKIINKRFDTEKECHSWVMPDGFTVHQLTYQPTQLEMKTRFGKTHFQAHKVAPNAEKCRSLVPNIIHALDGYIAREMIRRADFYISPIHDCFCIHANNASKTILLYNEIANELANSNILAFIVAQLEGEFIPYKVEHKETPILYSLYSLN